MVKALRWGGMLMVLILSAVVHAASLETEVDRPQVEMGDVLTLTLTARDLPVTQSLPAPDFSPLKGDFDIVGQETNTQLMVANGAMRKFEQWRVQLTPRHAGTLVIPALKIGALQTRPLSIEVKPASTALQAHPAYFLDNSVSPQTLYIQQQGLYTLRFYYRGDLVNGAVAPPTFGTAQVLRLANQATYRKLVDGLPYTVFEWRYAFFPSEPGTLTIPPQGFQGQLYLDRRLRQVSGKTRPLSVKVLPIPSTWPADTPWVPAQKITLKPHWIGTDKPLKAGDTVSLELTIDAEGQRAALIPAIPLPKVEGIRFYAEPPQLDNDLHTDGVHGRKVLRWTLLFEKAGDITLPALTLSWWDVKTKQIRQASVPARSFRIAASPSGQSLQPVTPKKSLPAAKSEKPSENIPSLRLWQGITALFALLTLLFMALWWRQKRLQTRQESSITLHDKAQPISRMGQGTTKGLCEQPADVFYRTLLQQRDRWPKDARFTEALHALERALLVESDPAAAETAKTTLCTLLNASPAKADDKNTTLKPLYPH